MIVVSLNDYNESLSDALNKLSEKPNIIVLAESLSNIHPENETIIQCIDRTLSCVDRNFNDGSRPDIRITAGVPIISKFFQKDIRNFPVVVIW